MIAGLLEKGEERLVSAVETGLLPLNLAIDISKTGAKGAQKALMDAYLAQNHPEFLGEFQCITEITPAEVAEAE